MNGVLRIETHDPGLGFEIIGSKTLASGTVVEVPGGIELEFRGVLARRAVDIPDILEFIFDTAVTVEISLVSAWLYDKVKNKPVEKITINRREVTEITEERIRHALEEEIRIRE